MDLREIPAIAPPCRHPWETVRCAFICRQLEGLLGAQTDCRVLDVGSGDAWFASQFLKAFPAIAEISCWDKSYTAEQIIGLRKVEPKIQFSAELPTGRFSLLLLLDVLEHVEEDHDFLRDLVAQKLKDKGAVMITVPAWQALYGSHDSFLRHIRRYSPAAARALITGAGLEITRRGMAFHLPLLLRLLSKARETLWPRSGPCQGLGEWQHGRWLTSAVEATLNAETHLSHTLADRDLALPGLSWWAVCRKA